MQVATLFRESSTLLGATMEAGGGGGSGGGGGVVSSGVNSGNGGASTDSAVSGLGPGALSSYDSYNNHPVTFSNKYKLNMKLESHDDGYETSADMLLSNTTASVLNVNHHDVKCEKLDDPYSFIDDDPIPLLPVNATLNPGQQQQQQQQQQGSGGGGGLPPSAHHHIINSMPPSLINNSQQLMPGPKKRGRKKKIKPDQPEYNSQDLNGGIPRPIKERKKHDRFNGMPEEEVSKRTLPDHLTENLDIIIIGINPGLFAAYKGHHYAGPGNHFWKCLYLSGLTQQQVSADEDYKLLQVGIGFTNMVQRATKGSADLTRKEIKEGSQILLEKLRKFRPKIAVFNGKLIYEVFSGKKDFKFGRQPDLVDGTNTYMWVMPSSSARCAQLPRAADKVPFYAALKKFRDYLNGVITEIDESEMVFAEPRVKSCYEAEPKPDTTYSNELTDISNNAVIKKEDGTIIPCKKKRGRPKKIKIEGEESMPKSIIRKSPSSLQQHQQIQQQTTNNCDFPKKKRGRPKKIKIDMDGMVVNSLNQTDLNNTSNNNNNNNNNNTTSTNMSSSQCYSNPSPIQSPHNNNNSNNNNFYQMGSSNNTNTSNSSNPLYQVPAPQQVTGYNQSPRHHIVYSHNHHSHHSQSPRPPYSQSPRPHSQPFTHSDLSSEISAAISSDQLGSPASPSLGPPDFEPPTSMADDVAVNGGECRLSSPAPSTNGEQQQQQQNAYHSNYHHNTSSAYHPNGMESTTPATYSPRQAQDIASKSLSGLESLVDQIPSITDGDGQNEPNEHNQQQQQQQQQHHQYSGQFSTTHNNPSYGHHNLTAAHHRSSPVPPPPPPYNYPPSSGYPIYPTPTWTSHYEAMPPLAAYPQLPPYAQTYGVHMPSPNYPYYSYHQPAPTHHPPGYPPYLGGF